MVWNPPTNMTVPVNQQDSLPIYQLGLAGNAGFFVSFGGMIFRYWKPTDLGFDPTLPSGLPTIDVPLLGSLGIVSNVLDLRGCRELALVAKRVLAGAAYTPAPTIKAYVWPQFSDGSAALFKADAADTYNSFVTAFAPISGTGTYVYGLTMCRGAGSGGVRNATAAFGIGFARIVVVGFSNGSIIPGGVVPPDTSWTWELWGQG